MGREKGSGQFDIESKGMLIVQCGGHLDIKGDVGATVRYQYEGNIQTDNHTHLACSGNLRIRMPVGVALRLEDVHGHVHVKGIRTVSAESALAGNVTITTIDEAVTLNAVDGGVTVKHISGPVTISGPVGGDVGAAHIGGLSAETVRGNLVAKHISGDLTANSVLGDATIKHVTDNLALHALGGDCTAAHLGGLVTIQARDDVKLRGPLATGKHTIHADSSISLYYPAGEPLVLTAAAPTIANHMQFGQTVDTGDGMLNASRGENGPVVTLTANDRITLRERASSAGPAEAQVEIDIDFGAFGEQLAGDIGARMAEFSTRFEGEINGQAERALRKAQEAIDRAINRMEREMERAEQRATRKVVIKTRTKAPKSPTPPTPPVPPKPPTPPTPPAPAAVDTSSEQLKILKMLEEGIISIEEANKLLAALG